MPDTSSDSDKILQILEQKLVGQPKVPVIELSVIGQESRADGQSFDPVAQSDPDPFDREILDLLLSRCHGRERTILELVFVQGMLQTEVAYQLNLSRQRVHQILTVVLNRLRPHAISLTGSEFGVKGGANGQAEKVVG